MKNSLHFELCAESLESALVAQAGGADRIELCTQLSIGGITPDPALTAQVVQAITIPVHVLIRPRGGNFVYTAEEFALIRQQTLEAKAAGAAGVVIGILLPDGRVDVPRTSELVQLAAPLSFTFHRAFDESANLSEALEDIIRTGAGCILTSGGKPNVSEGVEQLAALQKQAAGRITLMAGGGITVANILTIARQTGVHYVHGSLIRKAASSDPAIVLPSQLEHSSMPAKSGKVLLEDVQQVMQLLHQDVA